jgi:hypothetical protein
MKTKLHTAILFLFMAWPFCSADNVTVHGSLGMLDAQLVTKTFDEVGTVNLWNTTQDLNLMVTPADGYLLSTVYVTINTEPPPPPVPVVEPDFGEWPYVTKYKKAATSEPYMLTLNFEDDLDFEWGHWGPLWLEQRLLTVAVRVELKSTDAVPVTLTAWAFNPNVSVDVQRTGWGDNALAMRYEVQHPMHGQFVDAPVIGLNYGTRTHAGSTGTEGGFWFYPGEFIIFSIGSYEIGYAQAGQRMTPLDIFASSDPSDIPVANMARLLQSMDADGEPNGSIDLTASTPVFEEAMAGLGYTSIDFTNTGQIDTLIAEIVTLGNAAGLPLVEVSAEDAVARLEQAAGNNVMRRNISKSPEYEVDKPKLDIMPVYVPARQANGTLTEIVYRDANGNPLEAAPRQMTKPLFVTYTEKQDPNPAAGITRSGSDIITAVSLDDGATWKRFNVSKMARRSSFTLETGERFPGDSRGPQQKIAGDKILIAWTSAYARGGKPSFAIKTDDAYPYDDAYAVTDYWGVRGRQGSVDYNEDKDVGDQGIGEIPYYALWTCRGVLVWEGNQSRFPTHELGDVVWFKPERLTSGRRDAFFPVSSSAKDVGFAIAWQEDPGGLLPGSCKGGGHGWSGATVHKKTDIWYSYIGYNDFDLVDTNYVTSNPEHSADEFDGPDEHGNQPEISNRPKWLVPMSLPVRVSDNNTVNTDNLKVQLDEVTGLPLIDPETGGFIPLDGAIDDDFVATEHEGSGNCDEGDEGDDGHDGSNGTGGGWGMARYAYMHPALQIADKSGNQQIWDNSILGDYRPEDLTTRWYRFVNKPGVTKTVAVTPDGRVLDGNTGACRPMLVLRPGGWAILGYEESKGLGEPPEGEHEEEEVDKPEPDDSGKNIIYHSFKFNQPDLVSGGDVLNLPALDDAGNLIPIYYKDALGESTGILRQYKTENARRIRFLSQPKSWMGSTRTSMVAIYRQGREGQGKPSDIFAIRNVVPTTDKSSDNPYRFSNFIRYGTGAETSDPLVMRFQRRHMNMSSATVESMAPGEYASDAEGHSWTKVGKWKQYQGNMSDESFQNPYADARAHRGFLRGDTLVLAYSYTPNWGRLGGDHEDFYVRRSFDGGQTWTTDPNGPDEVTHTVIERDPATGEYQKKQYRYQRGGFEPARNVSLLKGNSHTVTDPRLVPPMGPGTLNPKYPQDDVEDTNIYYVAFGTADVLHGIGDPATENTEKDDVFYTRTTDNGSTWLMVPWVINPDSSSPDAGETVYRWPWLAQGTPHQGHSQIRMHPSGTRLYAIWHQYADGDDLHVSPHDMGNDIWFRRIDFMDPEN